MYVELSVLSERGCEFVDITGQVEGVLAQSGVLEGVLSLFVPHTTAGLTVNENWDPDVTADTLSVLDALVPHLAGPRSGMTYQHAEGNSAAHVKASLLGSSQTLPIHGGRLALGHWQGIFLAEFDGPKARRVIVTILTEDGRQ
jgi:secondary thiamine-phosphate synthase enzyme